MTHPKRKKQNHLFALISKTSMFSSFHFIHFKVLHVTLTILINVMILKMRILQVAIRTPITLATVWNRILAPTHNTKRKCNIPCILVAVVYRPEELKLIPRSKDLRL